ncbi:uncharacterized protein MYCGRDRAFT_41117 [Zymoseptoria tritici IPO323]|uniref:LNS2/PITP domain-containing protein n=1 Tax=Zymoseptoria tritici (strain CBS 115943 / IPO323) TaxID=336722 RepID=F9X8Y5_ZYMTI|nr:uncharacterized protein MYCGRDRAFT_41117 [Zymoseptoria tritici IPO323]EGP87918.1 hypothetical protein MYCGRDRAFT_41117 [Zymoseptoria tritici IPO323]
MQYVRAVSGAVSSTWNSINPATLSGAIDVVVVEQADGSLACSPFHIRFGKFSLLRPHEKKVEFRVNGEKKDFPMKLGEGGEAFFVFETQDSVPEALQTSPPVSPVSSPEMKASPPQTPALQEPDPFDLESSKRSTTDARSQRAPSLARRAQSDLGEELTPISSSPPGTSQRRLSGDFTRFEGLQAPPLDRQISDSAIPAARAAIENSLETSELIFSANSERAPSPLPIETDRPSSAVSAEQEEARARAMALSKKLWTSNISNQVTEAGDLMLDMTSYKSGNMEALQAEGIARQLLSQELDGPYDIGALIGADEKGNIWIYSSEEAKEAANKRAAAAAGLGSFNPAAYASADALSDPGYHSDDARSNDSKPDYINNHNHTHARRDSDSAVGMGSQPSSPGGAGDPNKNYAKTLRLTSDQLKTMNLQPGGNSMSFTVNRATCTANLWYWHHDVPIVISDIDGTITKSDVLGHVLNTLGRDWTHSGVAKLYTEIASNGYNFLYLTSRSVGQADTTRAYLNGVVQEGFRLPKGPVILSPDRTIAALRREVYLRKPEIFKMACLRDIMALFSGHGGAQNVTDTAVEAGLKSLQSKGGGGGGKAHSSSPFYAGFGNRLTDALSYRSVNIPSIRIFTINSNSEISLDLLSLNNYKTAYSTMREIVDHYFPPVGLLVKGGGEEYTDFNYWRERPLDVWDFTDSESEDEDPLVESEYGYDEEGQSQYEEEDVYAAGDEEEGYEVGEEGREETSVGGVDGAGEVVPPPRPQTPDMNLSPHASARRLLAEAERTPRMGDERRRRRDSSDDGVEGGVSSRRTEDSASGLELTSLKEGAGGRKTGWKK